VRDLKGRLDQELQQIRGAPDARELVARRVRARARRRKLAAIPAAMAITVAIVVPLTRIISPGSKAIQSVPSVDPVTCSWTITPTPSVSPQSRDNFLNDVVAIAPDDVWAVGNAYLRGETGDNRTLILHWDGSSWSVAPTPEVEGTLESVAAVASDDVWAVGSTNAPSGLVMHWNGRQWSTVDATDPGTRFWGFRDAAATGPNDVWAVGWTATGGSGQPLAEHWDGSGWSVVPVPSVAPSPETGNPYASFEAIAAGGSDDVWAVGERTNVAPAGLSNFLTAHWDGTSWTTFPIPDVPTQSGDVFNHMLDVAVAADGEAIALGSYSTRPGTGYGDLPAPYEWGGTTWNSVSASRSDTPLTAVARVGKVWLAVASGVPAYLEGPHESTGRFMIWDGAWSERSLPGTEGAGLDGLSVGSTELWVVGTAPGDDGTSRSVAGHCS